MLRSMTGYCSVREMIGDAVVSLEIKALNHKSFDFHFYCPKQLSMLEAPLRNYVQNQIKRGRLEIYLRTSKSLVTTEEIVPNPDAAKSYLNAAQTLAQDLNLPFNPTMEFLLQVEGIMNIEETHMSPDESWALLENFIKKAITTLVEMKLNEGKRLHQELKALLNKIASINDKIILKREVVIEEQREKLVNRISEWKETIELDPNRVIQEVAFYTDKGDIQEECVRLKSHIEQFHEILDENSAEEPYKAAGRRLDFLCQEFVRETNTIGSKSSSIDLVRLVLELKGTIEQLREQVQNVE